MNNGPQLLMTEPVGFKATTSVPAVPNSIWYAYHPTILTDSSGILEMLCGNTGGFRLEAIFQVQSFQIDLFPVLTRGLWV